MSDNQPRNFEYPPGFVRPEKVEDMADQVKKLTFPGGFSCYAQSGKAAARPPELGKLS
jgi:hypothetical protein